MRKRNFDMTTSNEINQNQNDKQDESVDSLIRRSIREGRFVPGQRLVEIDLMTQFDASQRKVRSALRRLEAEGIVSIEKNRGARVRKISRREVSCILDVLDSLSLLAVRQAAEHADNPENRALIKQSLEAAKNFRKLAATEKKVQKYLDENVRFWNSIAAVVDNPFLWEARERLNSLLSRLQGQVLTINSDPNKWLAHHEGILMAVLKQDVKRAESLVLMASADIREAIDELGEDVYS